MSNILDAIKAQYEKNKQSQSQTFDNEVDFSKYFAVRLEDGQDSGEQTIRLMPTGDGSSPFEEGYWHTIQVGGKWRKLYCKKHNDGEECPLCEVENELKSTGSEEDKKISKQFKAKKFYIVKLIDRANEQDGVKLWRFPHNWKGEGALDKLIPIFTKKGDVTQPREGRDLVIILGRDDKKYTKITSIMAEDPSLLTSDTKKAKEWIADTTGWRDIYKAQPTEYLQIIANGDVPMWDKVTSKFVAKGEENTTEGEERFQSSNKSSTSKPTSKTTTKPTTTQEDNDDEEGDDLPF